MSTLPFDRLNFPNIPRVAGHAGILKTRIAYYRGPRYDGADLSQGDSVLQDSMSVAASG